MVRRERYTPTHDRSLLIGLKIRSVSVPNGGFLYLLNRSLRRSIRLCGVSITNDLTSEGSSPNSMLGSYGDYGRTDASVGAAKVGNSYRRRCCTASWGWSACYNYTFKRVLREGRSCGKLHAGKLHVQFERRTEASLIIRSCA